MKRYNVSIVYNQTEDKVLMCYRTKEPYKDMYNFVGGRIEDGEKDLDAAYRELFEETGITKNDIELKLLITYIYNINNIELQVYVGKLKQEITVVEEVNRLYWIAVDDNFFNLNKFAGEGNIGHMIEQVKIHYDAVLKSG